MCIGYFAVRFKLCTTCIAYYNIYIVTCVRSVMVYGSETWAMNVEQSARLERTEMRMVQSMCCVSLRDTVPSWGENGDWVGVWHCEAKPVEVAGTCVTDIRWWLDEEKHILGSGRSDTVRGRRKLRMMWGRGRGEGYERVWIEIGGCAGAWEVGELLWRATGQPPLHKHGKRL